MAGRSRERAAGHGTLHKLPYFVTIASFSDQTGRGNIMFRSIRQLGKMMVSAKRGGQPPAEEDLGGGDICSLQEQPSTDDDEPLE
jgi:hypothetical protein